MRFISLFVSFCLWPANLAAVDVTELCKQSVTCANVRQCCKSVCQRRGLGDPVTECGATRWKPIDWATTVCLCGRVGDKDQTHLPQLFTSPQPIVTTQAEMVVDRTSACIDSVTCANLRQCCRAVCRREKLGEGNTECSASRWKPMNWNKTRCSCGRRSQANSVETNSIFVPKSPEYIANSVEVENKNSVEIVQLSVKNHSLVTISPQSITTPFDYFDENSVRVVSIDNPIDNSVTDKMTTAKTPEYFDENVTDIALVDIAVGNSVKISGQSTTFEYSNEDFDNRQFSIEHNRALVVDDVNDVDYFAPIKISESHYTHLPDSFISLKNKREQSPTHNSKYAVQLSSILNIVQIITMFSILLLQ